MGKQFLDFSLQLNERLSIMLRKNYDMLLWTFRKATTASSSREKLWVAWWATQSRMSISVVQKHFLAIGKEFFFYGCFSLKWLIDGLLINGLLPYSVNSKGDVKLNGYKLQG